jgi:hypothetical protein
VNTAPQKAKNSWSAERLSASQYGSSAVQLPSLYCVTNSRTFTSFVSFTHPQKCISVIYSAGLYYILIQLLIILLSTSITYFRVSFFLFVQVSTYFVHTSRTELFVPIVLPLVAHSVWVGAPDLRRNKLLYWMRLCFVHHGLDMPFSSWLFQSYLASMKSMKDPFSYADSCSFPAFMELTLDHILSHLKPVPRTIYVRSILKLLSPLLLPSMSLLMFYH